jgi:glutaredoxin-dependent peroxiredoxin
MADLGSKAPDFSLVDTTRTVKTLADFAGRKTVLAFFPAAFTGPCTKEMCTFQDSMAELNGLDAHVVGISVDGPFANAEFAAKNKLDFPLLCDYKAEVVKAYGVVLENFAGLDGYTAAQRAVFVLDPDGVIRYKWVAENPGIEPDYTAVKAALGSL